jgi:hypothetical protein
VADLFDGVRAALSDADLDELVGVVERAENDEATMILGLISALERQRDPRLRGPIRQRVAELLAARADPAAAKPWSILFVVELAASLDPLTGMRRLEEEFARSRRINSSLLFGLRDNVATWPPDVRERWLALLRRLVEDAAAHGGELDPTLDAWFRADAAGASHYLTHELNLDQASANAMGVIIRGLLAVATPDGLVRVRTISEGAGPAARAATMALQALGFGDQGAIEALADSADGPALFISLDEKGGMRGWKYK